MNIAAMCRCGHHVLIPAVEPVRAKSGLVSPNHTANLSGLFLGSDEADFYKFDKQSVSFCQSLLSEVSEDKGFCRPTRSIYRIAMPFDIVFEIYDFSEYKWSCSTFFFKGQ